MIITTKKETEQRDGDKIINNKKQEECVGSNLSPPPPAPLPSDRWSSNTKNSWTEKQFIMKCCGEEEKLSTDVKIIIKKASSAWRCVVIGAKRETTDRCKVLAIRRRDSICIYKSLY